MLYCIMFEGWSVQSLNNNHFFIFDIWLLMVLNFRYKWIRSLSGLSMYFYLAHT